MVYEFRDFKMKYWILLIVMCIVPVFGKSQVFVGAGAGVNYGGMGAKISYVPCYSAVGVTGGIGYSNGGLLSFGIDMFDEEEEIWIEKDNVDGIAFSLGLEYVYPNDFFYGGIQFVGFGKFQLDDKKQQLLGVNWTMLGALVPLGNSGINIDFSGNLGYLGTKGRMFFYVGLNIGIGFMF